MGVNRPRNSYQADTPPDDRPGVYYSFYKPNGYTRSKLVTDKLKGADKIIVWDPSFSEKDIDFYKKITSPKITLEILTICNRDQRRKHVEDFFAMVKDMLVDKDLEIDFTLRAFNCEEYKDSSSLELWHDRYLIVERNGTTEVYLVGTSVSSHLVGHKAFGICRLIEEKDKNIVLTAYTEYCSLLDENNGILLHEIDPE